MPKKNQPYIYSDNDNPINLAEQNGITPQQLFEANPGGTPFSVGQQINIPTASPFQYSAPIGPQPASLLQQRMAQPVQSPYDLAQRGRGANVNGSLYDMRGRGYGQATSVDQINAMRGRGTGVTNNLPMNAYEDVQAGPTGNVNNGYGGFENKGGPDNTDFANTAAAQYNAANNIPFLQQSRWDPKRRKYISVGQWLRQNRRGGRGRGGGKKPPEQKQQEFTLTNSFLDFNVSAG
jgi:hypothetical protein